MDPFNLGRGSFAVGVGVLAAVLSGCGKATTPVPPPADVQVIAVVQKDVPMVREWVGSLQASVNAQIRAQVTGYLVKQDYKEGSVVKQGDILFEIDPRPFAAALARAQLEKARLDVVRFTPLARDKAISQEELDDAVQGQLAAEAQVASARAAV